MGQGEKKAYLQAIQGRYKKAKRADKSKILDEFCAVCSYHRKHALRLLRLALSKTHKKKPGRPSRYDCPEVLTPTRHLAFN